MYPCPYIKKSVSSLSRIILKIRGNNINYQSIRMSELCDELYKEDLLIDYENSQQGIKSNKHIVEFNNEKTESKNGKKRIIIKIKICDIRSDGNATENDPLIKIINRQNCNIGYGFNNNKFLKHFESKATGRTYTIELTESVKVNILPELDCNENLLIEDYRRKEDENDTRLISPVQQNLTVPKKFNYENNPNKIMDDINSTMHIVGNSNKQESKETSLSRENVSSRPKEANRKNHMSVQEINDVATIVSDQLFEQDKCIYFCTDKNETNSKKEIARIVELKNFENDQSINSVVQNTCKDEMKKYEDNCQRSYVIDINIPKEGKGEDVLNEHVIKTIKNMSNYKNNGNSRNIEFINNESMYYIGDTITQKINEKAINSSADKEQKDETYTSVVKKSNSTLCPPTKEWKNEEDFKRRQKSIIYENSSLVHKDNNGKITNFQDCIVDDTNKAKETLRNKETNIAKSITTTYKLSNSNNDKQEKEKINTFIAKQSTNVDIHCLPDKEKIKDSLVIKDLIMNKYGETLKQFMQRSLRRKQIRQNQSCDYKKRMESKQKLNRPMSLDIKNLPCDKDFSHLLYNKTPDSGLEASQELDYSNCKFSESIQISSQSLKYSPTTFLMEALGDEYMNITYDSEQENLQKRYSTPINPVSYKQRSNGRSIGSSEISTLISTVDGVESLYSTIDKSRKKIKSVLKKTSVVSPLFNSTSSDTYIYESIGEFKINPKSEELHVAISVQSAIIGQVSKALSLCKQSTVFFGTIPHLEAEKYLLFATYKKIILENQLNRDYEEMKSEQCFGTVNVENLRFVLNTGHSVGMNNVDEHYMCLLHSDATLLASNIVLPERNGQIIFQQSFQFNNLMSDFEIYIKIFSMVLENKHKKKMCLSPTKIRSTWKNGKIFNKHTDGLPETSSFRLLGTSKIGVSDLYKSNSLYLEKVSSNGRISDTFTADIRSSIKITNNIKGFLTIGTTNILWNRRWCNLEGPFLKYWNYPSDEHDKEPIGVFDLTSSITRQVSNVEKSVCSRSRTVMLQIQSEEQGALTQYFLQADNLVEFEEWKRQINSVLLSLNNWKYLKNCNF